MTGTRGANASGERLESWKQIATYLERDVTTVRRWEKQYSLPVHRLQRKKLGAVFAYPAEIDSWIRSRSSVQDPQPVPVPAKAGSRAPVALAALAAGFVLAGAALLFAGPPQRGR